MRPTAENVIQMFEESQKKHLLITGTRQVGKTTLFNKIVEIMSEGKNGFPGLTSIMIPNEKVILKENLTDNVGVIGVYCPEKAEEGRSMVFASDGFLTVGIPALQRAIESPSEWISIDELGFLESNEETFQKTVIKAFESKKIVAVVRKQPDVSFLAELTNRKDVFVLDLDIYV